MNFVVFSDDWGLHPSSSQHLFRHIAREHRVLWVNTVGMRTPKLSVRDLRKAVGKVIAMLGSTSDAALEWTPRPPLLHVIQPPMLPIPQSRFARRVNAFSLLRAVRREMVRLSMESPVIVSTVPNAADVVGKLEGVQKIYYCVDDFSQWPGLAHDAVRAMENDLVANADLVLAASPVLRRRFAGRHHNVELFPHGVDLELFRDPLPAAPEWLVRLPRPRVGYYGLLDERLDQDLVGSLAKARPDWSFILAGPRAAPFPALEKLANVHFPGNIPYRHLPALVHGLDALIMPYRVDAFTHTLAPLKLNEYLLSGLPVITSILHGIPADQQLIRTARSSQDWMEALNNSLGAERVVRRDRASMLLADQGWEARSVSLVRHAADKAARVANSTESGQD